MNPPDPDKQSAFEMSEPAELGTATRYAFWLTTEATRLFPFTAELICVAELERVAPDRARVSIHDAFDADEAWHFIRSELETESQFTDLDSLWEDALWLL